MSDSVFVGYNPDALQYLPGLNATFAGLDAETSAKVSQTLYAGLVTGTNPKNLVSSLVDCVSPARAEMIARTEMLGAYRSAALDAYRANSDVVGQWMWSADLIGACIACLEQDGSLHDLDEDMDGMTHPSCRCTAVPVTASWSDILGPLGIDASGIEETSLSAANFIRGDEWFAAQTAATQREIMGQAAWNAWQQGDLHIVDLVSEDGGVNSLKSLGLDFRDYLDRSMIQLDDGFAIKEPPAALTREALSDKSMAELRQIARDLDVTPARSKAETIDRILAKSPATPTTPAAAAAATEAPAADPVVLLRNQIDDAMLQRESLYAQQHDLLDEQAKLENRQQFFNVEGAEYRAKIELYHESLDQSDPEVKRYLKDLAARDKAQQEMADAKALQDKAERTMDRLALAGKKDSAEYTQAKADYDAAVKAYEKAGKASERAWGNLWEKSPGVYKPEMDSIYGFEARYTTTTYGHDAQGVFRTFRHTNYPWTPEQVAAKVTAAREKIAGLTKQIEDIKAQVKALEKPIRDINKKIDKYLAEMRDMSATLRSGAEAFDTMRPFSDVLELPEGHQPPNALMNKLDYRMHEPRAVTKSRIIDDISARLKDNPAWNEYVARMGEPRLGIYHQYVHVYADAKDSKSAKQVADLVRKWGVGYRPGSPEWVAMQMATRDEFGLDAALHAVTPAQLRAGEAFYQENGAALRAFMRAQYDNTQKWFEDNGITEIDVYRGFHWDASSEAVPKGINWGPMEGQTHGITDIELNPFQSFSADINISQGTGGAGGAFGGGFASGHQDYSLLVGARVPVDRVLSTAQTGFGAKLESEIVVMGRNLDTVAYRAGTRVEAALLRQAEEKAIGESGTLYSLADGTTVRIVANADRTFTMIYEDGPNGKLGTFKLGSSKTYKTEKGVNNALKAMRISNTYVPPDLTGLAVREGAEAAGGAANDGLRALLERLPDDATTPDAQIWLAGQLPDVEKIDLLRLDPQTARLVANSLGNILPELPSVTDGLGQIVVRPMRDDALALVTRDGSSIILNADKWADLQELADHAPMYFDQGWWVAQTPEQIIGHEVGHLVQLDYGISNDAWVAAMERVSAAGGDPLVSQYAGNKIEDSFAETFALLIYGDPTEAQLPIAREMSELLRSEGLDYNTLRASVGRSPLDLTSMPTG